MNTSLLFKDLIEKIYNNGLESSPRGQKIKELINCSVVIDNPLDNIITIPERKISYPYLLAELVWYLNGSPYPEDILPYSAFWNKIKNKDGTVNSNYGTRLFGKHPHFKDVNQLYNVINVLKKDIDSRQAVMTINNAQDLNNSDNKDVPCTFSIQFLIRDNKLNMIVNMRSNDIILGFCNDIFQFSMIQLLVLSILKYEDPDKFKNLVLGKYYHNAGSMHLYETHFKMAEKIIASDYIPPDIADYQQFIPINNVPSKPYLAQSKDTYDRSLNHKAFEKDKQLLLSLMRFISTSEEMKPYFENGKLIPKSELTNLKEFQSLSTFWQQIVLKHWSI